MAGHFISWEIKNSMVKASMWPYAIPTTETATPIFPKRRPCIGHTDLAKMFPDSASVYNDGRLPD